MVIGELGGIDGTTPGTTCGNGGDVTDGTEIVGVGGTDGTITGET